MSDFKQYKCLNCGQRQNKDLAAHPDSTCLACGAGTHRLRLLGEIDTRPFAPPPEIQPAILNRYVCPECGHRWHDYWSCAVDDDCPRCETVCAPEESVEEVGRHALPRRLTNV